MENSKNTNTDCFKSTTSSEMSATSVISLLPDDVLFLIFKYLLPKDLCNICRVCKRFNSLTSKDTVWLQHAKREAGYKVPFSSKQLKAKEFCRVSANWRFGKFKDFYTVKVKHRDKLIPWIQKTDDGLWFSTNNRIGFYKVHASGSISEDRRRCLLGMKGDATRFLVRNGLIVSGCRNGSVYAWDNTGRQLLCYQQVHQSDAQCVDFTDNIIISGSRDTTCKVLSLKSNCQRDPVIQTYNVGERVWCLQISPCQSFFAAGLAGCLDDPPVVLWDIESSLCLGQLSVNHRRGAGVFDLKFLSPTELLTCGYDTFMRLWDLRTLKCVSHWEEPFDSPLYCIETDGDNALAVGTARHGMVRLWDKRKTEPVQFYYSTKCNSPVYSMGMDYGHLYLALDIGLNVMDFTVHNAQSLYQSISPLRR